MHKVVEVQEIELDSWNDLMRFSAVATWFQTPEAYRFFSSLSFMEAFALGIKNEGELKGVVVGYIQYKGLLRSLLLLQCFHLLELTLNYHH